jgi:hypothetical protein
MNDRLAGRFQFAADSAVSVSAGTTYGEDYQLSTNAETVPIQYRDGHWLSRAW